jgi:O-antigen/teichoic acid export membrane protein
MASIDRFALGSAVGPVAVGRYFVAAQIASILLVLATALNQAWLPWLYERLKQGDEAARRQVVRATFSVFLLLAAGAAALALAAPVIVPIVAGPGFEQAIGLLRILAPASACTAAYYFVTAFLFYERRTGLLSTITLSVALFQLVLSVLLVRAAGATGVAVATLAAQASYWAAVWIAARRVHPMSWRLAGEPVG